MNYKKLRDNNDCAYPKRKDCNYDMSTNNYQERKYQRCKYMKYDPSQDVFSSRRWMWSGNYGFYR